jgi:hypothetical protein
MLCWVQNTLLILKENGLNLKLKREAIKNGFKG